jgi:hypothetical protein
MKLTLSPDASGDHHFTALGDLRVARAATEIMPRHVVMAAVAFNIFLFRPFSERFSLPLVCV